MVPRVVPPPSVRRKHAQRLTDRSGEQGERQTPLLEQGLVESSFVECVTKCILQIPFQARRSISSHPMM
jgi:hypothetical protein